MLPIIYITTNKLEQEKYLDTLVKTEGYLPYYIFKIEPIKTEISIDQIRAIKKEIITDSPHQRLFIIFSFDTASLEAQNAFLKTLEEKNQKNLFVMIATDLGRVLPTIQSRSKIINGEGGNIRENTVTVVPELFNKLEQKPDLSFFTEVSSMKREGAINFFDQAILHLEKDLNKGNQKTATILRKALLQKNLLLNNNLNPQLAVDAFLIYSMKVYKSS